MYVHFVYNYALTNVDGLGKLTSVGGFVNFYLNSALMNIDGILGLTSVGGNVHISSHAKLTSVSGLSNIKEVNGTHFEICDNKLLSSIPANITTLWGSKAGNICPGACDC